MSEPLRVIMMGGRRCGKTSALASLFSQMCNGPVSNYFTVSDRTILEEKDGERQDSLIDKTMELENMLETNDNNSNIFLVDQNPTSNFWFYKLHLQIPGTRREMDIEFRDSAGEFFEVSGLHTTETEEYIKHCDVFVVVIDTPYLMGPCEETSKDMCTNAINIGTNRVQDIQNFLTNIDNNDGKDAKMVVFVPLKCEKWAKQPGGLERVKNRVKEVYKTHIQNLMAYEKMNISIIPMMTAGNILFSEFKKAYIYKGDEGVARCCKVDDKIIRKENGDNELLMDSDQLIEDPASVISGTKLMRPYSWYHINSQDSSFAPHNCEQLPLHIIRFMLNKYMDAESNAKQGDDGGILFKIIIIIVKKLKDIFGTMDIKELKYIIDKMQKDNVIKDNGEGIEIIKRF